MTYGWNHGPHNPRPGDAELGDRADDPDLSSLDGDPDGLGGGDPARAHRADPAAGPGRAGGFGGHGTGGNADTWISGNTGAGAVTSSHWQPGYEPLGHPRPGGSRVADAAQSTIRQSTIQRSAIQQSANQQSANQRNAIPQAAIPQTAIPQAAIPRNDARQGDAFQDDVWPRDGLQGDVWRGDARQGNTSQWDERQRGARPSGARPSGAWSGEDRLGETSRGAVPSGHRPYQPPGYAPEHFEADDESSAGQGPAAFGYRPRRDGSGVLPQTQGHWGPAPPQTEAPAGVTDEPGGYVPAGYGPAGYGPARYGPARYEPAGYQPPGATDVVSYGYTTDPAGAAHQRWSESSAGDAGVLTPPGPARGPGPRAHPDWANEPADGGPADGELWDGVPGYGVPGHGDPEAGPPEFVLLGPTGSEPPARAGRSYRDDEPRRTVRRGRRSRIWPGVGALLVIVVAAAAVFYGMAGRSSHAPRPPAAPARALAAPQAIGTYSRDQQAEQVLDLRHNEQHVTQIAPGHVSGIVAAVYDTGGPASSPDRVAVIAGRLMNSPPADVIKSFMQQEAAEGNAPTAVPAGPLGGRAACAGKGKSGICLWVDASTVGVVVSATINPSSLAREMLTIRSGVEVPAA